MLELVELNTLRLARNITVSVSVVTARSSRIKRQLSVISLIHSFGLQFHFYQHTPVNFVIENLDQAATYRMIIFAVNMKGRSEPIIIDDINFKGVAKLTGK